MRIAIRKDKEGEYLAVLCETASEMPNNVTILTEHEGYCDVDKQWVYECTCPAQSRAETIKFEVFVQNVLQIEGIQFIKKLPSLYKMYKYESRD